MEADTNNTSAIFSTELSQLETMKAVASISNVIDEAHDIESLSSDSESEESSSDEEGEIKPRPRKINVDLDDDEVDKKSNNKIDKVGIEKQCASFAPHPALPKHIDALRSENNRLKDRCYALTASNTDLKKQVDSLVQKRDLYERSNKENVVLKERIVKLEKELNSVKVECSKLTKYEAEVKAFHSKHESLDAELQSLKRINYSMLHVPIKNGDVAAEPIHNPLGPQKRSLCYDRPKKGINCKHIVVAHPGSLKSVEHWYTAEKKSKMTIL